jgi:DNA-binding transcriptional MerR regulator
MRLRVDELAARSGLSVDTVRFYQSKGLLGQPAREGRIAWYSNDHLEQLERVRALKGRGFTLDFIGRLLGGELDPIDAALAAAVSGPVPGENSKDGEVMTLEQLAAHTGVSEPFSRRSPAPDCCSPTPERGAIRPPMPMPSGPG